jgi:hypothetical protein
MYLIPTELRNFDTGGVQQGAFIVVWNLGVLFETGGWGWDAGALGFLCCTFFPGLHEHYVVA